MPVFISKLQYKTCEEGEFYDEQPRTLEETLTVINSFPWLQERFAEVDLIGPSVTIASENREFLKIGIHYGGTFHLYYLAKNNNLYERFPINIDDVKDTVTDFFKGNLKLHQLEKQSFSFFKRRRFITRTFQYTITTGRNLWMINTWLIFSVLPLILLIFGLIRSEFLLASTMALVAMFFGALSANQFFKFYNHRHRHLYITRGNDIFIYGEDETERLEYSKADIKKIIHYYPTNTRANSIEFYDIIFNDNNSIRFSNILISNLETKFAEHWKLKPEIFYRNTFSMEDIIINQIDK